MNRVIVYTLIMTVLLITACGGPSAPTPVGTSTGGVSVGVNTPTTVPSDAPATSAPTEVATAATTRATTAATRAPTTAPRGSATPAQLATYSGSGAPFTVQYPSDWTPADLEQDQRLVVITSPDQESSLILTYGAAGNLTAEQALETFLKNFTLPNLQVSNLQKNADGSMNADLSFDDPTSGSPIQGQLRLVRQATSTLFYVIIFGTTPEKFAQSRVLANTLLNSFQEKTSIVRQNTPPVVAPVTNTPTPVRPTATLTPLPPTATNTSLPPTATNTPLPPPPTRTRTPIPAPQYRLDLNVHGGYEDWGWPKEGCNSFATGQFDNTHPSWKLSVDVTFYNDSTGSVRWAENTTFVNQNGAEMLACYISDVADPPVAAKSQAKLTFFIFSDRNVYLSAMRIDVPNASLRRCFARNKSAQEVACN